MDDTETAKALDEFEAEWGGKYPSIAPSRRRAWQEVIPFFALPPDDAATKLIYLAIRSFEKADRCV